MRRFTTIHLTCVLNDIGNTFSVPPREKVRKKSSPITFSIPFPENKSNKFESVVSKLKKLLSDLNITFKILSKKGSFLTFDMIAKENTWSNQRRKRRFMRRLDAEESKKQKLEATAEVGEKRLMNIENVSEACGKTSNPKNYNSPNLSRENETNVSESQATNGETVAYKNEFACDEAVEICALSGSSGAYKNPAGKVEMKACEIATAKYKYSTSSTSKVYLDRQTESKPIVRSYTKLHMKENNIMLEMEFLDGTGGKECLHQIAQYIKNNLKFY